MARTVQVLGWTNNKSTTTMDPKLPSLPVFLVITASVARSRTRPPGTCHLSRATSMHAHVKPYDDREGERNTLPCGYVCGFTPRGSGGEGGPHGEEGRSQRRARLVCALNLHWHGLVPAVHSRVCIGQGANTQKCST